MVIHWHLTFLRPSLLPYAFVWEKTFKNLILQNRGWLVAESLHISSGTGGLPKLLNNCHTLTFNLFTARSSLFLYAFVWAPYVCMEKMLIISNGFSSGASGPVLLKFHAEPPWEGEWKIAKMGMVHWSKWLSCPYVIKSFKNLLLHNQ